MVSELSSPQVYSNLDDTELVRQALLHGEGELASTGGLVVRTGAFTGRSPRDKFVVQEPGSENRIWWGEVNQPVAQAVYETFRNDVIEYLHRQPRLFTQSLSVGADPLYAYPVDLTSESAYAALFCRHLFITHRRKLNNDPITILHAPGFQADPERHGCRTSTAIMLHPSRREIVIAGTLYSGELKKSVFSLMQYLLPNLGVATMHCSASYTDTGTTVFFGLSGTGKTTLSNDPAATLIGDDEHGWSEDGVFNLEGGCYAKTAHLSPTHEPTIWAAANAVNTVLENVVIDAKTGTPDFDDLTLTENTRAAYSVDRIENIDPHGRGGHARRIIFLSADASGVLPPVSRLTREQALSLYLLGFTSKIAGTERDIAEPERTFSQCFGAPFLMLPPERYAELLADRIDEHTPSLWLINTGWNAGDYRTGKRISIHDTRAIVTAISNDQLEDIPTSTHPIFNLDAPTKVPGVDATVLNPMTGWSDPAAYTNAALTLMQAFRDRAVEMAINPAWIGWLER